MELSQVGKYAIIGKIGAGAMGEVFRAHDPVLGRDVAIKVVLGRLSEDERARERFLREARAAAQLNHPNIITVYDFGEERGMAYMAMELLEGKDLRELLAQRKLATLEDKLAMMEQILDGLAFAHAKGVMHRDLKPGNVHVLPNGQIKIMDFGLARRAQDAGASGVVMGTPYYMAPEQALGERATARSDIFSLGAMFYEMLAGRRPFTGATIPAVLFAVVHRDPEPLGKLVPELATGIVAMVMRALAKDPLARHADASEMARALRVAWSGGEVAAEEAAFAADDPTPAHALGEPLSALADTSAEMRSALGEIEQYLADRVPPLMVTDSVEVFMGASVEAAAAELWGLRESLWAPQPELSSIDVLQHAFHKLSVIGELQLVDNARLLAFLRAAGALVAQACPPGAERDRFRRALARLGQAEMVRREPLPRAESQALAPLVATTPGLVRLSLLEQRLRREGVVRGPAAEGARRRVVSQAIATAATEATSERELESHLLRLRAVGVASGAEHVFRSLGQELGDWVVPTEIGAETAELAPAHELQAMQKIVALPEDPVEVARRYRHLVNAATEQFNEGNLGRAVQMFALATALAAEKKIEAGFVEPIRKMGHEALDPARLRQYMDRPDRLSQLHELMTFFEQGMSAETLLNQLETEERRDKRRLLLDLLVIHGEASRTLARGRLEAAADAPAEAVPNDFARRNWIYLLRHIPRPGADSFEAEIDAAARCAAPGQPAFLVKEALTHLGQMRHPRLAEAFIALLGVWEEELARPDLDDAAAEDAMAALDRVAAGLARQGGPKGWRALVRHGLSRRQELGNITARLAELGSQDLSASPDVVRTLTSMIREGLPKGMLSRFVARPDHDLPALLAALSGTRAPEVRALLEDVRKRFPTQEVGKAAARALETAQAASGPQLPGVGTSGELDGYTLPALLYRLAQGRATGTLNLLPHEGGGAPAALGFAEGRLVSARFAHREGENALYQLFERPFAGEFAFDAEKASGAAAQKLPELPALVREGVRRSRELAATSALVPEDLPLEATGEAPGTVVDEADYELIVALWQKAVSRVTPRQMEAELPADAFRIMRPLAQWLEQGALQPTAPPPAPGT